MDWLNSLYPSGFNQERETHRSLNEIFNIKNQTLLRELNIVLTLKEKYLKKYSIITEYCDNYCENIVINIQK